MARLHTQNPPHALLLANPISWDQRDGLWCAIPWRWDGGNETTTKHLNQGGIPAVTERNRDRAAGASASSGRAHLGCTQRGQIDCKTAL